MGKHCETCNCLPNCPVCYVNPGEAHHSPHCDTCYWIGDTYESIWEHLKEKPFHRGAGPCPIGSQERIMYGTLS